MTSRDADATLVEILERAFARHAEADGIGPAELQEALGLRSPYLAGRVFRAFDANGDGVIRKDEFLAGVRALVTGSDHDKLRFAFRVHDHDGDGSLDREELARMIAIALAESRTVERPTQPAEHLADVVLSQIDENRDGRVSFEELERALRARPHLLEKMTRSEAIWIAPNEELLLWLESKDGRTGAPTVSARNPLRWAWLAAWVLANALVFAVAFLHRADQNLWMQAGRALGVCLSLNGALVVVPVLRRILTRLRARGAARIAPIDDAIDFHKIVGHALFAISLVHAGTLLVARSGGHHGGLLPATRVGITGAVLLGVFSILWTSSLGFFRKTRRFELFYFTHLLYVAWFALAIVHAPRFLLYAGLPLLALLVEQIVRLRRRGAESRVVAARALRSGVTSLVVERPKGFAFQAGDYAFLQIPDVARYEWHPFTVSSAPEREELTFHVRSLGNWSGELRRLVEEGKAPSTVRVDGPYGSPSAHIFASRRAVLIGAGIGVTPFASVLESLVLRAKGSGAPSALERVHFFWLNRDAYSFEWFSDLLRELERIDDAGLLEVHLCMTGAQAGATALGLELARDLMRSLGRSDAFTGLRTHTHTGSPDWRKLLGGVAKSADGVPVDVYYCGPPGLAKRIEPICDELGLSFREERF